MPTTGSYKFNLAKKAQGGVIADENDIEKGEWAWIDRTADYKGADFQGQVRWLMIYARCPDCGEFATLWRRRGSGEPQGHDIDGHGNVKPSILHSWKVKDVEQCGFHTYPTQLLSFTDLR
jgi:hypothetical protein